MILFFFLISSVPTTGSRESQELPIAAGEEGFRVQFEGSYLQGRSRRVEHGASSGEESYPVRGESPQ